MRDKVMIYFPSHQFHANQFAKRKIGEQWMINDSIDGTEIDD